MRIVFINEYALSYVGGVEQHIRSLSRQLHRRGCQVTLLCRSHGGRAGAARGEDGIRVRSVTGARGIYGFFKAERARIDICHAHMARKPFALEGLLLARLMGIPTVFTPHCFYPSPHTVKRIAKWLYDVSLTRLTFWAAERIINLTPHDQRDAVSRGMPLCKSRIVPNSIELSRLHVPGGISFREKYRICAPYLLHVGRFAAEKCIEFLVRAQRHLAGLHLVLIGQDDGMLPRVLSLRDGLGLSGVVHVMGKIQWEDVCAAYRECVALVMGSRYEGLPTTVLEAWAFGRPAIAPRVGGLPHLVDDGVDGWLYDWGDESQYIACVRQALARANGMLSDTPEKLKRDYSWEINVDRILSIYEEIMNQRSHAHGQS